MGDTTPCRKCDFYEMRLFGGALIVLEGCLLLGYTKTRSTNASLTLKPRLTIEKGELAQQLVNVQGEKHGCIILCKERARDTPEGATRALMLRAQSPLYGIRGL